MRSLLSFLAGSLASVNQFYYMQDPTKLTSFKITRPSRSGSGIPIKMK